MNAANRLMGRLDNALHEEIEEQSETDLVTALVAENQRLSRQLKAVVSKAKQNEEKLRRFQALELELMSCTSLSNFFDVMLNQYRAIAQLDHVTLCLLDTQFDCGRIIESNEALKSGSRDVRLTQTAEHFERLVTPVIRPYLGPFESESHQIFFPREIIGPASIAIVPLVREGEVIGTLNLVSRKTERFVGGTASDFLQRFGAIAAVCYHNVLIHEQLKRVGLTDGLTGVNNRRFFDQRLVEEIISAQRSKQPICALFFDMDRFKQINDTYGHSVGDAVLREVASVIRRRLRANDIFARYGGEEFAALLTETPIEIAFEIAERIRKDIASTRFMTSPSEAINGTVSIGIACMHPVPELQSAELLGVQLLRIADENLYEAKKSGRNRVVAQRNE